jgi:hypothetical protein
MVSPGLLLAGRHDDETCARDRRTHEKVECRATLRLARGTALI